MYRTCNLCKEKIEGGRNGFITHGDEKHPTHFVNGAETANRWSFQEKKYFCPLDGNWYFSRKHMARAIKKHGWTNEQYFLTYGKEFMPEEWAELTTDPKFGAAYSTNVCLECGSTVSFNQSKWHYPVFCSFSCSTTWMAKNTDRVAIAMATLDKIKKENPDHQLKPNQRRYWVLKGFSEEEAIEKVKERQSTNSLERFIKCYGDEEGPKRFNMRQERWMNSVKKSRMFSGRSNAANSLFEAVSEKVPDILYGTDEAVICCESRIVAVDCLHQESNKVIEFFGTYWHADPLKYSADKRIKDKTAQQIWERDAKRLDDLRNAGFDVLVVWERETNNFENVVEKCVRFLTERVDGQ